MEVAASTGLFEKERRDEKNEKTKGKEGEGPFLDWSTSCYSRMRKARIWSLSLLHTWVSDTVVLPFDASVSPSVK